MNIGSIICDFTVQAMANGIVLAHTHSVRAPGFYAVYQLTDDGCGVNNGEYFENRTDAEWEFCGRAFGWFEDNAPVNMIEDEVIDHIKAARENIAKAAAMVDELIAMLGEEKAAPQEEIAEQRSSIAQKAVVNLSKMLHREVDIMVSEFSNRVSKIDDLNASCCCEFMLRYAADQQIAEMVKSLLANVWNFDSLFL